MTYMEKSIKIASVLALVLVLSSVVSIHALQASYIVTQNITWSVYGIGADASGVVLTLDGVGYFINQLPVVVQWMPSSVHNIVISSPVYGVAGNVYTFTPSGSCTTTILEIPQYALSPDLMGFTPCTTNFSFTVPSYDEVIQINYSLSSSSVSLATTTVTTSNQMIVSVYTILTTSSVFGQQCSDPIYLTCSLLGLPVWLILLILGIIVMIMLLGAWLLGLAAGNKGKKKRRR